jgi:hypothetical protein
MHCDGSFPACLAADGVDCRLNSNALLHTTWRPKKTGVKTGVKLKSVFRFAHYSAIFGGAKRNLLRVKIRPSSAKRKFFCSPRGRRVFEKAVIEKARQERPQNRPKQIERGDLHGSDLPARLIGQDQLRRGVKAADRHRQKADI